MGADKDWDKVDKEIRRMHAARLSTRAMARHLGLYKTQVIRRIKKLGLDEERAEPKVNQRPDHIADYKRARRGFDVPAHLENQYFELIKSGLPIAEACRRLGINSHAI